MADMTDCFLLRETIVYKVYVGHKFRERLRSMEAMATSDELSASVQYGRIKRSAGKHRGPRSVSKINSTNMKDSMKDFALGNRYEFIASGKGSFTSKVFYYKGGFKNNFFDDYSGDAVLRLKLPVLKVDERYKGTFLNGSKHGVGAISMPLNGSWVVRFKGLFLNNRLHEGCCYAEDGLTVIAVYEGGMKHMMGSNHGPLPPNPPTIIGRGLGAAEQEVDASPSEVLDEVVRAEKLAKKLAVDGLINQMYQGEDFGRMENPLVTAVKVGSIHRVAALLKHGADVNAQVEENQTALIAASKRNNAEIAKLLLDAGADTSLAEKNDMTPLKWACFCEYPQVTKVLLDAGAEVDFVGETRFRSALLYATNVDVVKLLLQAGANVHMTDNMGGTALHSAASRGRVDTVKVLLEAGADVNAQKLSGYTPLISAAGFGQIEVVKVLLACGARKDATIKYQPNDGLTALELAKENGHSEVVALLSETS